MALPLKGETEQWTRLSPGSKKKWSSGAISCMYVWDRYSPRHVIGFCRARSLGRSSLTPRSINSSRQIGQRSRKAVQLQLPPYAMQTKYLTGDIPPPRHNTRQAIGAIMLPCLYFILYDSRSGEVPKGFEGSREAGVGRSREKCVEGTLLPRDPCSNPDPQILPSLYRHSVRGLTWHGKPVLSG